MLAPRVPEPTEILKGVERFGWGHLVVVLRITYSLAACIASRPGQCGRADGYVLEGKELEFYLRKIKARKGK